ncbi:MAG TPA: hypothetical protein VLF63_00290 [Patescibacteria group bacterium]|nr:hypothetical protein [Patescibacteria group bacterium]
MIDRPELQYSPSFDDFIKDRGGLVLCSREVEEIIEDYEIDKAVINSLENSWNRRPPKKYESKTVLAIMDISAETFKKAVEYITPEVEMLVEMRIENIQ